MESDINSNSNGMGTDDFFQRAGQARQEGKQGLGAVGSTAFDVAESIGGNLSAIGTSLATGGAINPLAIMAVQSGGGQAAYNAKQKGANINQQLATGVVSGSIEALTEKLPLEGLKILAKGGKTGVKALFKGLLKQGATGSGRRKYCISCQ